MGKPHELNVQRKYKSVWIAVGEFQGRRIQVTERTETEVVVAWVATANSQTIQ